MSSNILFIAGTRPEVIKVAPAVREMRKIHGDVTFLLTGQHREMARQALEAFGMRADIELDAMKPGAGLAELTTRLIEGIDTYYRGAKPAMAVVQGDTTSAAMAGLIAFYNQIPVAHIEAGLRSNDVLHPFPEEVNRKVVSSFASLNFAPTQLAKENLLKENVSPGSIIVTGNTVVDAVEMIREALPPAETGNPFRRILVTTHRRESWSTDIARICHAVRQLADANPDIRFLLPVHRNPVVSEQVHAILGGHSHVELTEPLDYLALHQALRDATLVLTDSGGIQEEAPTYGVPVLVLRRVTERPEAVNAGLAQVVGTETADIVAACQGLLDDPERYSAMTKAANPFGDGLAGRRIAFALKGYVENRDTVTAETGEFTG